MEDILASIKRIIAEDGEAAPPPSPRVRRGPVAVPDPIADAEPAPVRASVPETAEEDEAPTPDPVAAEPAPAAPFATAPFAVDVEAAEPPHADEAEGAPPPHDVLELTSPMVAPFGWQPASILSAGAEQASRHAFASLVQARPEEPARGSPIEGFLTDMLRPMLSEWLDRELPPIVERIVTAEVRRLSGRG